MSMLTQPGFDRDISSVLDSDAPFGPGCVSNISVSRRGLMIDDLITIIDFCDAMARATNIIGHRVYGYCDRIGEAHDLAHALTAGDAYYRPWAHIAAVCKWEFACFGPAWPDVRRRMTELVERATEKPPV